MTDPIIFMQITCPNNKRRMKRYEITDGLKVCPACGQLKGHYIYGIKQSGTEVHEQNDELTAIFEEE